MNDTLRLLESVTIEVNNISPYKYTQLSESEKMSFNKETINKLFKTLKDKCLDVNYFGIENTKGDVTKYKYFDKIYDSINYLVTLYDSNPSESPSQILKLNKALNIFIKQKNNFIKAFNEENQLIIMFYTNMFATLIASTGYLISSSIEYIKQPETNSFLTYFKENSEENLNKSTYFKSIESFLSMERNGNLDKMFKNINKLNESNNGIIDLNEGITTISIAIIAILFLILSTIKYTVYMFYSSKKALSDYLLLLAYFLEDNANKIDKSSRHNKVVYKNQIKTVEKLKKLSQSLNDDVEKSEVKAKKEMESDDKNSSQDNKNDPSDNQNDNNDDSDDIFY